MSSLISSTDAAVFSGGFQDLFDTVKRNIIIFKEPRVIYSDPNDNPPYPGYENPNDPNVTYEVVSGQYQGQVIYRGNQNSNVFQEVKIGINDGIVTIKVEGDARDYIKNGKTQNIVVDGNTYDVISSEWIQNYLGLNFYYFALNRTT